MRLSTTIAALGALSSGLVNAASTFSPARPPSIPLAVKSPYLNSWLDAGSDGGNGGYLAGQWSVFWRYAFAAQAHFVALTELTFPKSANNRLGRTYPRRWCCIHVDGRAFKLANSGRSNRVLLHVYPEYVYIDSWRESQFERYVPVSRHPRRLEKTILDFLIP
jgi:hypothetical protein